MKRSTKDYLLIGFKGMAMGAADVVPGVSGGTIAFISGIYEELLSTIAGVNLSAFKMLKEDGVVVTWKKLNLSFLLALLTGVFVSVISLAKIISYLLTTEPVLLWSFFFGLVTASILFIGKQIEKWRFQEVLFLVLACVLAYYITVAKPLISDDASLIFLFFAGALAICAMILPGISGAFILVLLGAYQPVLNAVHTKDLTVVAVVGAGCIVGLLTFSRLLKYLFANFKSITLAVLTGFVLGSLNKIWPWKETLSTRINSKGLEVAVLQKSVLPFNFNGEPKLFLAIVLALIGFVSILVMEKLAKPKA